jgi:ABC-type antimicrobial peptide transport system ATPase subunit
MDPVSGELDFSNSKFVSDADMRSVQRAVNMIYKDIATLLTPRKYLNLRDKLNQLAKYATVDASRGQALIRQIRHTLD